MEEALAFFRQPFCLCSRIDKLSSAKELTSVLLALKSYESSPETRRLGTAPFFRLRSASSLYLRAPSMC